MKLSRLFALLLASSLLGLLACESAVAPEMEEQPLEEEPVFAPTDTLRYLALGDSYTIGQSVAYEERFPVQLSSRLRDTLSEKFFFPEPDIVARTGWTTTALQNAINTVDTLQPPYGLVTLLIGVNNQYQRMDIEQYRIAFGELLQQALSFAGGDVSRLLVVSIPDYAYTPFGQNRPDRTRISEEIDAYNQINREWAESLGVAYFDITPISRLGLQQPELAASDGLHPSGEMYRLWVDLLFEHTLGLLE